MKSLLKLAFGICCVLSMVCCTSEVDEEIFEEVQVTIQEDTIILDGGQHDPCRKGCE